ncbi:tyrosine-type recombinase/integrase [Maritimibacter sp. DP07]|uniref:Tyrosine-type recombinase/integrase n=1 Tax=Maritimibacter harenae TaxID=2606218 RepID=A0A845MAF2_9RHOB|nr:tyrosine-type recombinase/integrase [Maritimibacter harenae]MZR15033.1 tyrosine-type recombinase/integrase [Maritimibacter harenae]
MPLEPYKRGSTWWAKGRVEFNGTPITDYMRVSTGSSSEEGARRWIEAKTQRSIRGHLLGSQANQLTFSEAVELYDAKPKEARYLLKILDELSARVVNEITPKEIRDLGPKYYPNASTDTWFRQVVTPVRSVINNAAELGRCHPIKVKHYSKSERIAQDAARGHRSRRERQAADRAWVDAFCTHADPYNAALLRFMFETGARIDQAISLLPEDCDLMNQRVWLKAQKGHEAQWVKISRAMMVELANLPPKRPHNRKTDHRGEARVFGYGDRSGYRKAWATICQKAGIPYMSAHDAGRAGFYTELRVRQGIDPISAAKAGRWTNSVLPDQRYARPEDNELEMREKFRTDPVQNHIIDADKYPKRKRK